MEHTAIQPGEIHTPYQWIVVDAAARAALVPESTDLNKTCLQLSDKTIWRLSVISPATWVQDHTHDYDQLLNKPTLGTAASKNTGAGADNVILGNDTRLSDARTPTAHSHAVSDVTGLQTALDSKADLVAGKVPAGQLPSYVDDVLEYANTAAFPGTGESGKIYVALDTGKIWRWSGSAYVEISASPGSTDSVTEGSNNLYFTAQRVRDAVLTGLSVASSAVVAATDSVLVAIGKLQAQVSLKLNALNPTSSGTMVHSGGDVVVERDLTGSLVHAGFVAKRSEVSGGANMRAFRDPVLGGVGWEWRVTADNSAELSGTYTPAMVLTNSTRLLVGNVTDDGSTRVQVGGGARFTGNISANTNHGDLLSVGASGWLSKAVVRTGYANNLDFTEIAVPGAAANSASMRLYASGEVVFGGAATVAAYLNVSSGNALRLWNPANSGYASIFMGADDVVHCNYTVQLYDRLLVGPVTDDGSTLMQVGGSASFSGGVAGQGAIVGREGATGGALLTSATGNTVVTSNSGLVKVLGEVGVDGHITPASDNVRTLGTASYRWSTVYAGTGTINTSDAREKTAVRKLVSAEINASKQIASEIGAYRWLAAIEVKGDHAREHIGLTVQRAIEIMRANNLDPFAYGFICHDTWEDVFVEHPAIPAADAVFDEDGVEVSPAVAAQDAWTEQTQVAGDRYAFRYDELLLFIARGFEARLSALEAK